MPEAVVSGALIGIGKDFISFVYFFKLIGGSGIVVAVWMVLESELAESFFYVLAGSVPVDSEDLVIITFYCHCVLFL